MKETLASRKLIHARETTALSLASAKQHRLVASSWGNTRTVFDLERFLTFTSFYRHYSRLFNLFFFIFFFFQYESVFVFRYFYTVRFYVTICNYFHCPPLFLSPALILSLFFLFSFLLVSFFFLHCPTFAVLFNYFSSFM